MNFSCRCCSRCSRCRSNVLLLLLPLQSNLWKRLVAGGGELVLRKGKLLLKGEQLLLLMLPLLFVLLPPLLIMRVVLCGVHTVRSSCN
jgi:hypothetical protein